MTKPAPYPAYPQPGEATDVFTEALHRANPLPPQGGEPEAAGPAPATAAHRSAELIDQTVAETRLMAKAALGGEVEAGYVCLTIPARLGKAQVWWRRKRKWWQIF